LPRSGQGGSERHISLVLTTAWLTGLSGVEQCAFGGRSRISKPPPSATRPRLRPCLFNYLTSTAKEQNGSFSTNLVPFALPKRRVDGCRGLAVVRMEHVGVDRKSDTRLGVPQAFADGDNVDVAGDQLRGVGVPQPMKRDLGHTKTLGDIAPIGRDGAGAERAALQVAEQRIVRASLPSPSNNRVSKSCLRCTSHRRFPARA